jgi:hypothetical protein
MVTAKAVVLKYIAIVFPPILLSFFTSDNEATPVTREAKTRGIAISLRRLINMVPKGLIQSLVNSPYPFWTETIPYIRPKQSPIIICQWRAIFFIKLIKKLL